MLKDSILIGLVLVTSLVWFWIGWKSHAFYTRPPKQPMGTNPPARPPALTPRRFRP